MSELRLILDEGDYIILMEDAGAGCPEGYYIGERSINTAIYSRGSREEAMVVNKETAIRTINSFLDSGYPCRAEPPITVTYNY